ncbi:MAG: hypothetical protein WDW38_001719 [Sanguina aurantia]
MAWVGKADEWFHKATKGTPNAKYLAYICAQAGDDCYFGMGDRLRGIELMVRAAVASKRVLLVDIPHPIPFTKFFTPAEIDWSMGDIKVPWDAAWWMGEGRVARLQSNEALGEANKFVAVQGHGEIHILPIVGGPDITWLGLPAHCTFHALFLPSPQVEKKINELQTHLGVLPPARFLAIHLRLGGLIGEFQRVYRYDPVEAVRHSLRCARKLASDFGGISDTFVVITDSMELKNLILEGALTNTTTTRVIPAYSAVDGSIKGFNEHILPEQEHINTIADMGVMASATCLIADFGSGFSTHARLWGGPTLWHDSNPCFKSTLECIQEGGGGIGTEALRT